VPADGDAEPAGNELVFIGTLDWFAEPVTAGTGGSATIDWSVPVVGDVCNTAIKPMSEKSDVVNDSSELRCASASKQGLREAKLTVST